MMKSYKITCFTKYDFQITYEISTNDLTKYISFLHFKGGTWVIQKM